MKTFATETNNTLASLDSMLNRTNEDLQLNIYRKSTNKNGLKNICSYHCSRIESGILRGFY